MKLTVLIFLIFATVGLTAQPPEMKNVLRETIASFDRDTSLAMWKQSSDEAEKISTVYGNQWITHYYAAYAYAIQSFLESDKQQKDALLDCADVHLSTASTLAGDNNDEILVLKAMSAHARMCIDASSRWKKCGDIFNDNLRKAKALNPNNPRIYYLKGMCLFYNPFPGYGGAEAAFPYFEKAARLFSLQIDSTDITKPLWGKTQNSIYLQKCRALTNE